MNETSVKTSDLSLLFVTEELRNINTLLCTSDLLRTVRFKTLATDNTLCVFEYFNIYEDITMHVVQSAVWYSGKRRGA